MVDRGWRRSGSYLYKPTNSTTCCPQYTIRLDVNKFILSRSQKRVLRQMNDFLKTGKKPRCAAKDPDQEKTISEPVIKEKPVQEHKEKKVKLDRPVLKKKEIRMARFLEKCAKKGWNVEEKRREKKEREEARRRTIESYLIEPQRDWKHKLEVKLVPVRSDEFTERSNESFELYSRYQEIIHKDKSQRFANYRNFLCNSPIQEDWDEQNTVKLGSYHMWYILDGRLIAVGVVDVLSRCFSAKYMYYDPDYLFLAMGTYTALREIDHTKKLATLNAGIHYYYMGFYIDTCPKMRYKAKFRPSELLCDKAFEWVNLDTCKELFPSSTFPNGYTVFLPEADRSGSPVQPTNFNVWTKLPSEPHPTIQPYGNFLKSHPDFEETEEFKEKMRVTSQTLGPRLEDVVLYFEELNNDKNV